MGLLNNWKKIQELPFHITHMKTQQGPWGMFKKARSARPQALWRAERTSVREHDKGPRTLLTPFFNIPLQGVNCLTYYPPKSTMGF